MRFTAALFPLTFVLFLIAPGSVRGQDVEKTEAAAEANVESADATNDAAEAVLVSGTQPATPPAGQEAAKQAGGADAQALPSAAERIARLERTLDSDEKRLQDLSATLNAPDGEYAKAEANFRELDVQHNTMQQKLAELEKAQQQDGLDQLKAEYTTLEKKWTLAKERFNLAIGERKAVQENVNTLQQKLANNRASLDKLKGPAEPLPLAAPPAAAPAPQPANPAANSPLAAPSQLAPAAAPNAAPMPAAPAPIVDAPMAPTPESAQPALASPVEPSEPPKFVTKKIAKELAAASEVAQKSRVAAKAAEAQAQTITARIEILQKDIGLQRELRDTARKSVDNSEKTLQNLNEELFSKLMSGKTVDGIREQIREATGRLHDNRLKSRRISTGLDELQSQLAQLQTEKLTAMNDAVRKRETAQRDQEAVEKLKNPFTLRNLLQWLINHGPRIIAILLALGVFLWLSRVLEARLVALTAERGSRGSRAERENRAKTLLGVFRNVANIAVIAGGAVMILQEAEVPVAPLVGGAAVFGLAIAFGAQSLIKDYFTGFMVLLEQQYLVNDVIAIGEIKGQVERISLRITVLRDLEGRVHFVPHSQINTVTNLTHGWSRAVFEIGVAYKESVDRVIEVLTRLAHELRRDDAFRLLILSDPVMLGVDSFGNSAVVIKFYIQTRPLQQWTVKREMLRRIKNEFDRLGIEIPFPHLTVYRGAAQPQQQQPADEESGHWPQRDVA